MGIVKYSALITEIKGKIGGTVFQAGTAGKVVKNKQTSKKWQAPPQPYGSAGAPVKLGPVALVDTGTTLAKLKTTFGGKGQIWIQMCSQFWKKLTTDQIDAWNAAAPNFPFKNKYNEIYIASGFQVFMQLNTTRLNCGLEILTVPPLYDAPQLPMPSPPAPRLIDTRLIFTFEGGIPENTAVECYAAYAVQKGKKLVKGRLKQLAVLFRDTQEFSDGTVSVVEQYNLSYAYQSFFNLAKPNAIVYFQFVPVNITTGQRGLASTVPVLTNGSAPAPIINKFINRLNFPEIGTNNAWVHEFVLWTANLTGEVHISTPDPAVSSLRFSTSKTGPFAPELFVPADEFAQISQPTIWVQWLNNTGMDLNEVIHINSAGAAEKLIQAIGTTVAPAITLSPAAQAFGNVFVGLSSILTSYHSAIGVNDNNDLSIAGPDAAKFKIALTPAGPWHNNIIVQPNGNGKIAQVPVYVKCSPTAVGALSATLVLNNDGMAVVTQALSANGIAPIISPNFPITDFGNQAVGTTAIVQFEISAQGCSADLFINLSGANAADFKIGLDPADLTASELSLVPDEFGNVPPTVVFFSFTPSALGLRTANVDFNTLNAAPVAQAIQGTGV